MNTMSLKNKLSLAASTAILLVGVILTAETYLTAKSRLESDLTQQIDKIGNTFAASVNY